MTHIVRLAPRRSRHARLRRGQRRQVSRREPGRDPLPRSKQEEQGDRGQWPWLPGTIVEQCGPDEWDVCLEVRELAVLRDGRRAPRGTASRNLYYPCRLRDGSEIRPRTTPGWSRAAWTGPPCPPR